MSTVTALWCVAALIATGALAVLTPLTARTGAFVYGACLASSLVCLVAAAGHFIIGGGAPTAAVLPLGLPWLGAHFRLDALSAFFLVVVNLGAAGASLYGLGYGRHEAEPARVLPFYPIFLAGMNLVVLADDAFTFLVSWEFMSLSSWALVMAHHRDPENARAGYVYIVMAVSGRWRCCSPSALLAGPDGNYAFAAMRAEPRSGALAGLVLAVVLLGAGSKAGLVPLHVWLPLAHPAAPSHVSALMSGVMTKVAVYGFVRIVFDLARADRLVVEPRGAGGRRRHGGARRALRADADRPEARARLFDHREYRARLRRARPWRSPSTPTACRRRRRWR